MNRVLISAAAPVLLLSGCYDPTRELDQQRETVNELREDLRELKKAQTAIPAAPPAQPAPPPPPPRLGPGDHAAPPPMPPPPHPYGPGGI